jgi:hypothetical protein
VIGHGLVFLAADLAFVGIGHFSLAQKTCVFPESQMAAWASEHSACGALSALSILLGAFMLWPSLKLLYGVARR